MGQGIRSQLISIHILLIVTAIQGLTPDLHDLASERTVHLLCPIPDPSGNCEDVDPSADDVSGLMEFGQGLLGFMRRNCLADSQFVSAGSAKRMSKIDALQVASRGGTPLRIHGLVFLVCRLTC
jgi:hypothetical protein